jgi:1-hydroxycarotenoid 3,4-desaturase
LDLFADTEASAAAVRSFGGARAEADFRAFSKASAALFNAFDRPVMQRGTPHLPGILRAVAMDPTILPWLLPGMSLRRVLATRFRDSRLAQLFGRYATYVGGAPARSPAVLALIWEAEARGVWAVEGGMQRLAETIASLAERGGATILHGTVARIETSGDRVSAVVLTDGRRLPCSTVVHAGDPAALADGILGPEVQAAVLPRSVHPRSHSAWVWAFAATPKGLPLAYHNVMFAAEPAAEFDQIARGEMPRDPSLYLCAQDRAGGTPAPHGETPGRSPHARARICSLCQRSS